MNAFRNNHEQILSKLVEHHIVVKQYQAHSGKYAYRFTHPLIHEQLFLHARNGINEVVEFIGSEETISSFIPFSYIATHGPGTASTEAVVKAFRLGADYLWINNGSIELWDPKHPIRKGLHRLVQSLEGSKEFATLEALLLRTKMFLEIQEAGYWNHKTVVIEKEEQLLVLTKTYHDAESALRRLEALALGIVDYETLRSHYQGMLQEWEAIYRRWPEILETDENLSALLMLLGHSYGIHNPDYRQQVFQFAEQLLESKPLPEEHARWLRAKILFSQVHFLFEGKDSERYDWACDLWQQIEQHLDPDYLYSALSLQLIKLTINLGFFLRLYRNEEVMGRGQLEQNSSKERLYILRFQDRVAVLYGQSLRETIRTYWRTRTHIDDGRRSANALQTVPEYYLLCVCALLRFDQKEAVTCYADYVENALTPNIIDNIGQKQGKGLPFILPLTQSVRNLLESYRRHNSFRTPGFNRLIDAWLGENVPTEEITAILRRLLKEELYFVKNVWVVISALLMLEEETSLLPSEVLETNYDEEISIALFNLLEWFSERELFVSTINLIRKYEQRLSPEQKKYWLTIATKQKHLFDEYEQLHGRGERSEPIRLSMVGRISIHTKDKNGQDITGQRMRTMLGLIVADHMTSPSIGYTEFTRIAVGNYSNPQYARKYGKTLLTRVTEQYGEFLQETDGILPNLNRTAVYVDVLEAWDLVEEARNGIICSDSLVGFRALFRALSILRGDVVFPELYEDYFEELRDMFDGQLRSTLFSLVHLLHKENDYEKVAEILALARKRFLGDEEIESRYSEVKELLVKGLATEYQNGVHQSTMVHS